MTLTEKIKQRILKFLGLEKLSDNPNGDRYTYLSSPEALKQTKIQEYKVWYYGDSSELLNFYTAQESYGNSRNSIYNRNKEQYFWGLSAKECDIKRIHSGLPKAIVDTITNIVGMPKISCVGYDDKIQKIIERTQLTNIINQKQMPMTLACGWGAFKVVIDKNVDSTTPLVEWYNADDVEFVVKHGIVIAILYKDYYKYGGKDYVLIETRRIKDGSSLIEYGLYKLGKNNEVSEVELDTIPELGQLSKNGLEIKGLNKLLGVPSVFFYDANNENYGRSILEGKLDLFDDLDQDLSQASQTSRVSTPVEYIPVDAIERGVNGEPKLPNIYNRQFIASTSFPNGDGELEGHITTTQPSLNFNQYTDKCFADLNFILTGILSPATLGIDVAKKDNADAQREKEKISMMTRNNIIDRQTIIVKKLTELLLILSEYMETGTITLQDYDISVKFDEFANPSFENQSNVLSNLLSQDAITPELYVEKLYGDSLSDEEKLREVEYIKNRQQSDNIGLGDLANDSGLGDNIPEQEQEQANINQFER